MTKAEQRLLEKTALAAFTHYLKSYKEGESTQNIAEQALEDAYTFLRAKYDFIIDIDVIDSGFLNTLEKVLEQDGNTGRYLGFMLDRYKDKPDPLRAYAEDNVGAEKTEGQKAIMRFLEKRKR